MMPEKSGYTIDECDHEFECGKLTRRDNGVIAFHYHPVAYRGFGMEGPVLTVELDQHTVCNRFLPDDLTEFQKREMAKTYWKNCVEHFQNTYQDFMQQHDSSKAKIWTETLHGGRRNSSTRSAIHLCTDKPIELVKALAQMQVSDGSTLVNTFEQDELTRTFEASPRHELPPSRWQGLLSGSRNATEQAR